MQVDSFDRAAFRDALDPARIELISGKAEGRLPRLDESHIEAFCRHAELVVEANRRFNLTRITDPAAMATKHYLDSISCCLAVDFSKLKSAIDIGSGAGYPGIPLAILFPKTQFTLLEATHKKAHFLDIAVAELGLKNCCVVAERAETAARTNLRESFDVVLSRAVAPLPVLLEICTPFVKEKGRFCAFKGAFDTQKAQNSEDKSHPECEINHILCVKHHMTLHLKIDSAGERTIIISKKTSSTPIRFPRRPGIPTKRPLE